MGNNHVRIKATPDTRKNLRLLAALSDKTMTETLEQVVADALEKFQKESDDSTQSL